MRPKSFGTFENLSLGEFLSRSHRCLPFHSFFSRNKFVLFLAAGEGEDWTIHKSVTEESNFVFLQQFRYSFRQSLRIIKGAGD